MFWKKIMKSKIKHFHCSIRYSDFQVLNRCWVEKRVEKFKFSRFRWYISLTFLRYTDWQLKRWACYATFWSMSSQSVSASYNFYWCVMSEGDTLVPYLDKFDHRFNFSDKIVKTFCVEWFLQVSHFGNFYVDLFSQGQDF